MSMIEWNATPITGIPCDTLLQMYSLYKDPSGEVNLNFSNITTNLTATDNKKNKAAKKVDVNVHSVYIYTSPKWSNTVSNSAVPYSAWNAGDDYELGSDFQCERATQWDMYWDSGPEGAVCSLHLHCAVQFPSFIQTTVYYSACESYHVVIYMFQCKCEGKGLMV